MADGSVHASRRTVMARLKRAEGHLVSVVGMIEAERPCLDLAQQLHAVEKAIANAKRVLIQDHIDHCLDGGVYDPAEFRAITRYL